MSIQTTLIEQDCFLCEKTFKSYKYQSACPNCERIHARIQPTVITKTERKCKEYFNNF